MLFLNKTLFLKILTIFPYFDLYSEPLYATYASFGGGGSHIRVYDKEIIMSLLSLSQIRLDSTAQQPFCGTPDYP